MPCTALYRRSLDYTYTLHKYNNLSATTGYHPMHIHDICVSSLCTIYCTFAHYFVCIYAGPSLADAGPGARYGVGPPSVRLQWRYGGWGGGSIPFVAGRGARCDRTSCTAQRTALYICVHNVECVHTVYNVY